MRFRITQPPGPGVLQGADHRQWTTPKTCVHVARDLSANIRELDTVHRAILIPYN
jgi:hypothetical protein